jgi:hypothetical protein
MRFNVERSTFNHFQGENLMKKKILALLFVVVLLAVAAVPAFAGAPNFGPAIYADDQVWGTKRTADLPPPNANNRHSYDGLFKFPGGEIEGQMPVGEAAPGNPNYNGGRWIEYEVTWIGTPELITSYAQLLVLKEAGAVTIAETGNYFGCPLLPVK